MTRRTLLGSMLAPALRLSAQMASRGVAALPRGKPSGLPFQRLSDRCRRCGRAECAGGLRTRQTGTTTSSKRSAAASPFSITTMTAGSISSFFPARARKALRRAPPTGCITTTATARSPTSRRRPASRAPAGLQRGHRRRLQQRRLRGSLLSYSAGRTFLYRNNGDGTFTDVTDEAGLLRRGRPLGLGLHASSITTATASWISSSPTTWIFDSEVAAASPETSTDCNWKGVPVNCGPRGLPTGISLLYRNNGDGTFTDVSAGFRHSARRPAPTAMTAVAADFDNDGWPDIYVACDSTAEFALQATARWHASPRSASKRGVALQ